MSGDTLECPDAAEHLYLAASQDEVPIARPLMTGDVFSQIAVPGLDGTGLAIVLTHPCSMRVDGVRLASRLLMARVVPTSPIPLPAWRNGHFKVTPLPGLLRTHHSARFDEIGLVETGSLAERTRVACMTPHGVHLLQQRFIWYLTRFLAPTHRLAEVTEAVFEEADLQEEWVEQSVSRGNDLESAAETFHEWIRSPDSSGVTRQDQLQQTDLRAGVRRQMRTHLNSGN
ncbi:MAG: hypothetical protein F4126_03945 [Acidimicrobiaceae bacterium]|nr:hypothetical protein [Acidimicrobiaceae bacterium]MXZ52182.1 hypothetical protein [Acidimicrobiaceae bacterium]MYB87633.1 hypothetical protein [Acidimicrobiaceae bacterium]MYH92847.1 hypothetical protein [Acidimicrobiaceae bacterium]